MVRWYMIYVTLKPSYKLKKQKQRAKHENNLTNQQVTGIFSLKFILKCDNEMTVNIIK